MGKEEDAFFEKVLKANEKYYTKFKDMILENRKRGRDHQVLLDYLEVRDLELKGTRGEGAGLYEYLKQYRFNYLFYDQLFNFLETKFLDRIGEVV